MNKTKIYVQYNGATTLDEVMEVTGAGTICGACVEDVKRLVDEFVAEKE